MMLISIVLVLNLSSQFFFNSDVNNYWRLRRRRKEASESAAKERVVKGTRKKMENSRSKQIHYHQGLLQFSRRVGDISEALSHIDSCSMNTVPENFLLNSLLSAIVIESASLFRSLSHTHYRITIHPNFIYFYGFHNSLFLTLYIRVSVSEI